MNDADWNGLAVDAGPARDRWFEKNLCNQCNPWRFCFYFSPGLNFAGRA